MKHTEAAQQAIHIDFGNLNEDVRLRTFQGQLREDEARPRGPELMSALAASGGGGENSLRPYSQQRPMRTNLS